MALTPTEFETSSLRKKVVALLDEGRALRRGDDGSTATSTDSFLSCFDKAEVEGHARFLLSGLSLLKPGFRSLDASRPWLLFWIVHGLSLLGIEYEGTGENLTPASWYPFSPVTEELARTLGGAPSKTSCLGFVASCQNSSGGYGGGPQQLSHVATTYAAVAALVVVGGRDALEQVDREALASFLGRMQVKHGKRKGAFTVHVGGEVDMRACYLVMAVSRMVGLDPATFLDLDEMVEYIKSCQTYEGGFGGEPGNEAHGGYSYCAFAALALAGRHGEVDIYQLLEWASGRQQSVEGGFNGRTNKLVDSCYSWWQGALLCLIEEHLCQEIDLGEREDTVFHSGALQDWILLCCQLPPKSGGLRDKPGASPDYYHTCYALSGLSLCYRRGAMPHNRTDLLCNVREDKLLALDERLRREHKHTR